MNSIYKKSKIIIRSCIGYLLKVKFFYVLYIKKKIKRSSKVASNVIVSFTSYGRRVKTCAPYAAFSILTQTIRSEKIILWLDETKWNDNNLPKRLKLLQPFGLTVKYCEDIKSYTKLIPTLQEYPDKIIITVDDDIWYSKKLIKNLFDSHMENKKYIIANRIGYPSYNKGVLGNWNTWAWEDEINRNENYNLNKILALGVGGVLYPPGSFDSEVFNRDVFTKKCPFNDDIWFCVMAILNQAPRVFTKSENNYYPLDTFYQLTHKNSSLLSLNRGINDVSLNNNTQLNLILQHYNIKI